jgi:hypothetical protein
LRVPKILFVIGLIAFVLGIVLVLAIPTVVMWNPKSETLASEKTLAVSAAWQSKNEVLAENECLSTSAKWQSENDVLIDGVLSVPTWRTYEYASALAPYYSEAKNFAIVGNATEKSSPQTRFNFYIFDSVNFDLWETNKTYTAYYEAEDRTSPSFNLSIAEEDISNWFYFVVEEHVLDMKPTVNVMATISWIEKSYLYDYVDYCSSFGLSSFEEIKDIRIEGTATEVGGNNFNFYIMDYSNYDEFMYDKAYIPFYEAKGTSKIEFSVSLTETQATSSIYFMVENPNLDIDEVVSLSTVISWIEKSSIDYCSEYLTGLESTYEETKDFVLKGTATEEGNNKFNLRIFNATNYYSWENGESYPSCYEAKNVTTTSFSVPLTEEEATSEIYFVAENPLMDVNENVKVSATLEWKEKATVGGIGVSVSIIGFIVMVVAGIAALVIKPSTPTKTYYPQIEARSGTPLQNKCPSCNSILEPNDKFCPECGTLVRRELGEAEIPGKTDRRFYEPTAFPSIELIKAVIHGSAIKGATTSLFIWGIVNLGAWFLLGGESRSTLLGLRDPSIGIYVLAYSGALIGGLILLFSLIGAVTNHSSIVLLDGLALLGVGLWNIILGDLFAIAVLAPYGYTMDYLSWSTNLWRFLGLGQVTWGGRQIKRFFSIGSEHRRIDELQKNQTRKVLERFVKETPAPEAGHLELSIRSEGPIFGGEKRYSVQLLPEQAICIEKGLGDFFVIEKKTAPQWKWKIDKTVELVDDAGNKKTVSFKEPSLKAVENWTSIFSEIDGEPIILSSLYRLRREVNYMFLTSSKLIIKTSHRPGLDVKIPLNAITGFGIDTPRLGQRYLFINTYQKSYKFYNVENMEEWVTKLRQLLNANPA